VWEPAQTPGLSKICGIGAAPKSSPSASARRVVCQMPVIAMQLSPDSKLLTSASASTSWGCRPASIRPRM
jgi:hypothetical protein